MPESYFSSRKIRPRVRQEAVAYSITWRLHRGQRPLCGAQRRRRGRPDARQWRRI